MLVYPTYLQAATESLEGNLSSNSPQTACMCFTEQSKKGHHPYIKQHSSVRDCRFKWTPNPICHPPPLTFRRQHSWRQPSSAAPPERLQHHHPEPRSHLGETDAPLCPVSGQCEAIAKVELDRLAASKTGIVPRRRGHPHSCPLNPPAVAALGCWTTSLVRPLALLAPASSASLAVLGSS